MTAVEAPASRASTRTRRAVTGRPTRHDLMDAGFTLVLGLLALWGFRSTFDGYRFVVVGAVGLVLGIALAHIGGVLRQHWLVVGAMGVAAYFLFGGALAMSADSTVGFLPNLGVLRSLASASVGGWKDLLTTLPPVDGSGQLLVLPYLLGLLTGVLTFAVARSSRRAALPVVVPVALLVAVVALGTTTPAALLVHGLGLTAVAFGWVVVRRSRAVRVVGTGGSLTSQRVIGAGLAVVALGGSALVAGHLPGGPRADRAVLRTYVQPPFDVSRYPSPLVGFRKYTKGVKLLWDQQLLTVSGMPADSLLRLAVLDTYSGTAWGAGNPGVVAGSTFRKIGRSVDAGLATNHGTPRTVTIGVLPAFAGLSDASVWVPGIGALEAIDFSGPGADALAETLRYNPMTGQAVVASRLAAGDTIRLTGVPVPVAGGSMALSTGSDLDPTTFAFVASQATKWAAKKPTTWTQLQATAAAMRTTGAYTDGTSQGETQYLPGHGIGRLTKFVAGQQLVGNDEQYASTFALAASYLGVPTRVVFGATIPANGVVMGSDVAAWVEVRAGDGSWYAIPSSVFTPDRGKHPTQQPPPPNVDQNAAVVPPPNTQRPPGSLDATLDADRNTVRPPAPARSKPLLPEGARHLLLYVGEPLLVLFAVALGLAAARAFRRRRRRRTGPPSLRLSQGWRDYVDHARDLGIIVPPGLTRLEQASLVGRADLGQSADAAVFGWLDPDGGRITAYWVDVAKARRDLTRSASLHRRVLRWYTLRGLLARDARPVEQLAASTARAGGTRRRGWKGAAA